MNLNSDIAYTIFRNDVNDKTFYKIGLSRKLQDGLFENGYMPIQFKKDADIPNQTKIFIRQAWLTFYNKKVSVNGSEHKETVPYIFCNDFITVADRAKEARPDFDNMATSKPLEEKKTIYREDITITDDDLPF